MRAQVLRAAHVTARTVQLKVRFGDFKTVTRSRTLAEPTDLGERSLDVVKRGTQLRQPLLSWS